MTTRLKLDNAERRAFVLNTARMGCGIGMPGPGLGLAVTQAKTLPAQPLRPTGAMLERHFLRPCVPCGLFVPDCPPAMHHLAAPG